ncbi:MAG: PD-(D/E)XK nuclease family protein [Candidatus Hydrogenedentes bacterium]|nr:PD-(D/E)XK nuclease family protein [Candidatus Hydrogenedentota bacterium]
MARVFVITGGARSAREHEIDALIAADWGSSLLVVPTRHEANDRAARIIQSSNLRGAFGLAVVSFEDFVLALLRDAGIFPHEIDDLERNSLVTSVIAQLHAEGKLSKLGEAAQSPGFANHVLRVVTKLKQAAIEPDTFRRLLEGRSHASWLDPIVADIYDGYQSALHHCDAYDRVGIYWRAHVLLSETTPKRFERIRQIAFDGFDDFTPSEFRVIEQCAKHVDTLGFGLACNPEAPSHNDLYAIPLATLALIRKAFPNVEMRSEQEPAPNSRVAFVSTNLFWRDRPQCPDGIRENLALQPCHDRMHECEWIGREIKTLIVERQVPPDSIAVVFRRAEGVVPRLRLVLKEFGIPVTFHAPQTLMDSAFARHVLQRLDVAPKWEREAVVEAVTSLWGGSAPQQAHTFSYLARMAGVIEGKSEWTGGLQRFIEWLRDGRGEQRESILRRVPEATLAAQALLERVEQLDAWLSEFPVEASRMRYFGALLRGIAALRPDQYLGILPTDVRSLEEEAIRTASAVLRRMCAWERTSTGDSRIPLTTFKSELRDIFASANIEHDEPRISSVQVMSADAARYRSFDYLFLGGMNEGEFPAPPPTDAVYSDEDWADMVSAGARIELRSKQMEREMLLLHHVLGRAQVEAHLSWSTTSSDGRPLAQSPFVEDVKGLLDRELESMYSATNYLPTLDTASSEHDLRNVSNVHADVERAFPDAFASVTAGLDVEARRNSRDKFDEYDGILTGADSLAQLAENFGGDRLFSAAQLESYVNCPFQFFLQRVLRIEPDEAPDEEFDPRTRGRILHETLQQFHTNYREVPTSAIPLEAGRETLLHICGEVFDRHAQREVSAPRGVVRMERARLQAQLSRYFDFAREEESPWKPSHFEVGFGRAHATSDEPLTRSEPFALDTDAGTVLLSGRIDRIDLKEEVARIIDYKTTLPNSTKDVAEGVSLQLPLYAVALEEMLMRGVECREARLVQPGRRKTAEVMQRGKDKWDERRTAMMQSIARAVTGIRAGLFSPTPHNERCRVCSSCRVCRYETWRIERKTGTNGPDA